MNIFLQRIAATTKRGDIYEFVAPALKNGLFRKSARILNIDILALRDLRTGGIEHHGLVALDSHMSLQAARRLQNRRLNGKTIQVRPYYHRSWYNDPRQHYLPPHGDFVEKRKGDRRRGNSLEIVKNVSDHFISEHVESTTLHRQHGMASFIVPVAIEAAVSECLARVKMLPQPLLLNNILGLGYFTAQDSADNGAACFQIYAEKNEIDALLDKLRVQFPNSGIQYWITTIAESGKI